MVFRDSARNPSFLFRYILSSTIFYGPTIKTTDRLYRGNDLPKL